MGQTHDIKIYLYLTEAYSVLLAVQTLTLTIVALAIRQAEFIKSEIEKGNI